MVERREEYVHSTIRECHAISVRTKTPGFFSFDTNCGFGYWMKLFIEFIYLHCFHIRKGSITEGARRGEVEDDSLDEYEGGLIRSQFSWVT